MVSITSEKSSVTHWADDENSSRNSESIASSFGSNHQQHVLEAFSTMRKNRISSEVTKVESKMHHGKSETDSKSVPPPPAPLTTSPSQRHPSSSSSTLMELVRKSQTQLPKAREQRQKGQKGDPQALLPWWTGSDSFLRRSSEYADELKPPVVPNHKTPPPSVAASVSSVRPGRSWRGNIEHDSDSSSLPSKQDKKPSPQTKRKSSRGMFSLIGGSSRRQTARPPQQQPPQQELESNVRPPRPLARIEFARSFADSRPAERPPASDGDSAIEYPRRKEGFQDELEDSLKSRAELHKDAERILLATTALARRPSEAEESAASGTVYGRRPEVPGLFAQRIARKEAQRRASSNESETHIDEEKRELELSGSTPTHEMPPPSEITTPGAYAQHGRAYGDFPAWGRRANNDMLSEDSSQSARSSRWFWASGPTRVVRRIVSLPVGGSRQQHEAIAGRLPRAVHVTMTVPEGDEHDEELTGSSSIQMYQRRRESVEATAATLVVPDKIVSEAETKRVQRWVVAGIFLSMVLFSITIILLIFFVLMEAGIIPWKNPPESPHPLILFPTDESLSNTTCVGLTQRDNVIIQPALQCLCGFSKLEGNLEIPQYNAYDDIVSDLHKSGSLSTSKVSLVLNKTDCTPESTAIWWLVEHGTPQSKEILQTKYYLVSLFAAWNGLRSWRNKKNWLTVESFCRWEGVVCEDSGREIITGLKLSHQYMDGMLAQDALRFGLRTLRELDLQANYLSGDLPIGLPTEIERLSLSRNELQGTFPSEWGNLTNLISLNLSQNAFEGEIPADWGLLTNLEVLDLRNTTSGVSIPEALCQLDLTPLVDCSVNCTCCASCDSNR